MRRACITCALRAPLADGMCLGCVSDLLADQVERCELEMLAADGRVAGYRGTIVDAESLADDVDYLRMLRQSLLLMQHAGQISD